MGTLLVDPIFRVEIRSRGLKPRARARGAYCDAYVTACGDYFRKAVARSKCYEIGYLCARTSVT